MPQDLSIQRQLSTEAGSAAPASPTRKWAVPLIAALIVTAVGIWTNRTIIGFIKKQVSSELQTILNTEVAALEMYLTSQEKAVQTLASDLDVRGDILHLINATSGKGFDSEKLKTAPEQAALRKTLGSLCRAYGYSGYIVVQKDFTVVSALHEFLIGQRVADDHIPLLTKVMGGKALVSRPFRAKAEQAIGPSPMEPGKPVMFAVGPVKDSTGHVVALLGIRIDPKTDFTRTLSVARSGESGEAYAFNKEGLLLSESRFTADLKKIGLLENNEQAESMLTVSVRDPGGNLLAGHSPKRARQEQPLTRMATCAVAGQDGLDVEGYRDYRGVRVVGAWKWFDEYGFGVAMEMDKAEAFKPISTLRMVFGGLIVLLLGGAIWGCLSTRKLALQNKKLNKMELQVRRLGQYALGDRIGTGGMGAVYHAKHAMLRRPTAVKLLPSASDDDAIQRFEREVQLTSQLTHPNTISVYDFGRTPEGDFYYAMEYLPGMDLFKLAKEHGRQPEARVIHLLTQVCGSLEEAHKQGLIHRDIKPANLLLCNRGGIFDFIKVLDFGLAKELEDTKGLTQAGVSAGTPEFISPEAIADPQNMDGRADLYAVGAVGYFLLTRKYVFDAPNSMAVCMKHATETPVKPSEKAGIEISSDLEDLIMKCLEKDPKDRPQSGAELAEMLNACQKAGAWSQKDAKAWWNEHACKENKES